MVSRLNLLRRASLVIDYVLMERRAKDDYTYWALCLDDMRKNPREVDTCATCHCVSLLVANEEDANEDFRSNRAIIQSALNTIIKIRRKNGCWPSVVAPKEIFEKEIAAGGDVAIGDTCYALTALLDAGFLKHDFGYNNLVEKSLENHQNRIEYVLESINWLLDNRSKEHSKGWYYTNTRDPQKSVSTMTATSNVIQLFGRLISELSINYLNENQMKTLNKMREAFNNAIDFIIINTNDDGGIGRIISHGSTTSYIHTALLADILILRNNENDIDELEKAIDFLVSNYAKVYNNDFDKQHEEFFSEQYPLVLKNEEEIIIRHEHCVEGILLKTFIHVINKSFSPDSICSIISINKQDIYRIIDSLMDSLEKRQTRRKNLNGAFHARISRQEGSYPVYSSLYGFQSIKLYQTIVHEENLAVDEELNIELSAKASALEQRLTDANNRYGLNDKYKKIIASIWQDRKAIEKYSKELSDNCNSNRAHEIRDRLDTIEIHYNNIIGKTIQ